MGNTQGETLLLLLILLKNIWLNLWFGTALCKTPMEFPTTIPVSIRPMLFATMATLGISIVSMCLGSLTSSTFGSHYGKSFKLFSKKRNQDPPQARPPPS